MRFSDGAELRLYNNNMVIGFERGTSGVRLEALVYRYLQWYSSPAAHAILAPNRLL
jgi:hypothetical protein